MRTLLLELRPAALADTRLEDLLRQLGEAASGRAGISVVVQVEGQASNLPSDVQIAFYRITQEALNNVVKHARAHQVVIQLHYLGDDQTADSQSIRQAGIIPPGMGIMLFIHDDGRGFDPAEIPHNRLGLGIMQERAQAIGALLTVESQPGHGTQVTVRWKPVEEEEAK
jgi:signal transduction histidine kinase